MGLKTLIRDLAGERGVEIDEDELDALGLADDELQSGDEHEPTASGGTDVLSESLPGTAAGTIELFLAADSTTRTEPVEQADGLMWYPIIREGQWAVRPGATGKKRRVPLRVVSGSSTNQRREIGLQDLKDAFDDEAVQHVTVPLSHGNTLVENQGFIDKLKIVRGKVKDQKTKKQVDVDVMLGGYRITEPETKGKMERGTYANRSAGLLYDYVDTERGKTWKVVLEHVALTNKPWITGMAAFGRKLAGVTDRFDTVALTLSDEGPDEDQYALALSQELELDENDIDFLAQESQDWSKEGSPGWLRQQVDSILSEARSKKLAARQSAVTSNGTPTSYIDCDYPPRYRCIEARPGKALIADDYGDNANHWAAPITVKDGAVELGEWDKWSALKKAFIPDERPAPPVEKLPLSKQQGDRGAQSRSRLQLAQEARRVRVTSREPGNDNTNPREVVKQDMASENGTVELSEEARRLVQAAEDRAKAAEERASHLSEKVDRLTGSVQTGEVEQYIAFLKDDEKGLGLTEERGFSGVLAEIRALMLADDGEPALQSDHFAVDGNATGEISFSEGLKRVFSALQKVQEGKAKIGEQLSQPADDPANTGNPAEPGEPASTETAAGEGKPGSGEPEGDKLSTEQKVHKVAEASPVMASLIGGVPAAPAVVPTTSEGGDK